MLRIGVDTGGTFTDLVRIEAGQIRIHKVPTTPWNPAQAVLEGLFSWLQPGRSFQVIHGTTVATNMLLERRGARTALVTTQGFEDVLEIGRQIRPRLYDWSVGRPSPLVPRGLRFGVQERLEPSGEVWIPLDEASVRALIPRLRRARVESVAICLLHAYANPQHEQAVARILEALGVPLCLSSEILPEYREYERCSTTVVNAYVAPGMSRYLSDLERGLGPGHILRVMQSSGGITTARAVAREPVRTLLSGPAAGVVGGFAVARQAGYSQVMTLDMGGTSTDVALCPGRIPFTTEGEIAGYPVRTPFTEIHTVGAGGGSIAWVDPGGLLRVGPRSAGADPGPICYGRGGKEPTVTDAHLFLGRLIPAHFLGGKMALDPTPLPAAFARLGEAVGLDAEAAALGVLAVANAVMERALRVVSVERGYDPREGVLVVFGGAGGLHGADLARALGIPAVLVPRYPGCLSALGLLVADRVLERSRGHLAPLTLSTLREARQRLEEMVSSGRAELQEEGIPPEAVREERLLDLRYVGQSFELTVPVDPDPVAAFHQVHQRRYGYQDLSRPVEIVNLRIRLVVPGPGLPGEPCWDPPRTPLGAACLERRRVRFPEGWVETPLYHRDALEPGHTFPGPAVVVEYSATTVVPPDFQCRVDPWGNLLLTPRSG